MLRQATKDDLLLISKIDKSSNQTYWDYLDYVDSFNNENQRIMLYYNKRQLVGFMVLQIILDEMEILQLVISDELQLQGYGSKMFEMLLEYANSLSIHQIFLEVRHNNDTAINLYQKYGMTEYAVRKNYYKFAKYKLDAVLMKMEL